MTFIDCVLECAKNKELVAQFNRLSGLSLGVMRTPLTAAIDEACGYDPDKEAFPAFIEFVDECIWIPLCNSSAH